MGLLKIESDWTNAKYKKGEWVTFKDEGQSFHGKVIYYFKDFYGVAVPLRDTEIIYEMKEEYIMEEQAPYGNTTGIGKEKRGVGYWVKFKDEDGVIDTTEPTPHSQFRQILEYMFKTYKEKNAIYGDSYITGVKRYGKTSALQILFQKFSRMENIIMKDIEAEEGLGDSILDMANYLIMTYMAFELEKPLKINK